MEPADQQSHRPQPDQRERRHADAVANSLSMADEAAAAGDYGEALNWLSTLEAIGDQIPNSYEAKRRFWLAKLDGRHEDT